MSYRVANVELTVAPPGPAPFAVEAVVEEQDTALVLDTDPSIREPDGAYTELIDNMVEQQPLVPGDVMVQKGHPLRLLAIIHDLDREPSCDAGGIAVALENLLQQLDRYGIETLALPLLGTVHGRFPDETFLTLLYNALLNRPPEFLRCIRLIAPAADCGRLQRHLQRQARVV